MESFEQLCQHRRSTRKYTDRPIEQEKIDYILRCALMAPSGKRTTPWDFVVIRDEQKLRALQSCRTHGSGMFATATAAIVVALDAGLSDTWMVDGAIAAEHILLAAEEQGIGACWCHVYAREGAEDMIRQMCAIPENRNVLCVIALGYKDEEKTPFETSKLLYNKLHEEQF